MATGLRARIRDLSPAALKDGVGEREMYCFGLGLDAVLEKRTQAELARMPLYAEADALAVIAGDRMIVPGLTELPASLGPRLQHAFETWQTAGIVRAPLGQAKAYCLSKTPMVRAVATRFDPTTWPPPIVSTQWDTYDAARPYSSEPAHLYAPAGGAGEWDWDSASPITGSWGWWSGYLVLYSVSPEAWIGPAPAWGTGTTYTPDPSGYYSTVSGGAYTLAGSYSGSAEGWGTGTTYLPAASGYYSTVSGGAYTLAGQYLGDGRAWGVDALASVGHGLQTIARQFKPANVWVRSIVVSFDATLFDPAQGVGGVNPDGTWGQWSKVSGGAYVATRAAAAVYGEEVI